MLRQKNGPFIAACSRWGVIVDEWLTEADRETTKANRRAKARQQKRGRRS